MTTERFQTRAKIWLWQTDKAPASWHFATIDGEVADAIRLSALMAQGKRRGWGSVKIMATVGDSSWSTSLFPDKASGGWLLPLKASIRRSEGLVAGDEIDVTVAI